MTISQEDLRIMYAEETGMPIVSDSERQWYTKWLENKYIHALNNMESRIIERAEFDAKIEARMIDLLPIDHNLMYPNEIAEVSKKQRWFIKGAKYVLGLTSP